MFVAHRLPSNHTAFPGFSLFPLLVSADTATANDRSRSTTAMRSTSDSSIFLRPRNLSKHHFHSASKKMVSHYHRIVTTSFNRRHTQHIGKLLQKRSLLIRCSKPCVVFSKNDVACQASDVNHIVKNASDHHNVRRFTVYSLGILSKVVR